MQANEVMTAPVINADPEAKIHELAKLLLDNNISAVPIVSADGKVQGIVSEGDLIRQIGNDDDRRSWWLTLLTDSSDLARDYVKSHGQTARDVMTSPVLTVKADCAIEEIAGLLESRRIKRVFVMHQEKLVGVVSRANLLHGLAAAAAKGGQESEAAAFEMDDLEIRETLSREIDKTGVRSRFLNTVVTNQTANIFGTVETQDEKNAIVVAAKNVPGLKSVTMHVGVQRISAYSI